MEQRGGGCDFAVVVLDSEYCGECLIIPHVVQVVPGLGRGQVLGDENLGPDPLEVTERPGGVGGHGRLGVRGGDREEVGDWTACDVPVEHSRLERPFGSEDRGYGVTVKRRVNVEALLTDFDELSTAGQACNICRSYTISMPPRVSEGVN